MNLCVRQAGKLAMERGWAINVGGGFHHCSNDKGGGFCAYADITLSLRFLFERVEGVATAMIVDLDAHQVSWWLCDVVHPFRFLVSFETPFLTAAVPSRLLCVRVCVCVCVCVCR